MKRPYVIINCAMSADGKISLPNKKQLRISNDEDIERMYNLRNECDAVLVGIGTIISDDPKLTVKEKYIENPNQPLRVIIDSKCRTPKDALVLDDSAETLIITVKGYEKHFDDDKIEVIGIKADEAGHVDIKNMLDLLYKKGIRKILVEGGSTIIWSFLRSGFVDDFYVHIGSCIIGGKNTPTLVDGLGVNSEDELIFLKIIDFKRSENNLLIHYRLLYPLLQ